MEVPHFVAHANGESCTCARRVTPSPRRRRLERPTERTPRPYKGSGGGMFFASCSSSSSAIVAAGVQRPACQAVDYLQLGPQKRWVFGCRPAVYLSKFIYEHDWGCPCARTQLFCKCVPALVLHASSDPNARGCEEFCAARALGQRSRDASGRARLPEAGGEFCRLGMGHRREVSTVAPPCTRRSPGCSPKPRRGAATM